MTSTEQILQLTLDVVRRDGWKPNGWALVPPYCLRRAVTDAVNTTFTDGRERDRMNAAACQAISKAIGQPLGAIMSWEGERGRTQAQVEAVLEKAIAGVTG